MSTAREEVMARVAATEQQHHSRFALVQTTEKNIAFVRLGTDGGDVRVYIAQDHPLLWKTILELIEDPTFDESLQICIEEGFHMSKFGIDSVSAGFW